MSCANNIQVFHITCQGVYNTTKCCYHCKKKLILTKQKCLSLLSICTVMQLFILKFKITSLAKDEHFYKYKTASG